jgi:predicted nucleic acid-binding Zn ribbon protein
LSIRYLYRVLPASKRVCSYWRCGTIILRNLARTEDGRLWHYGCLQSAKDDHFHCLDCGANMDSTEITLTDLGEGPVFSCGSCGSSHLKQPKDFQKIPTEVTF